VRLQLFFGCIFRKNPRRSDRIETIRAGQSLAGLPPDAYRSGQEISLNERSRKLLRGSYHISPELATLLLVVILVALVRL
jgi:hypothetical protein